MLNLRGQRRETQAHPPSQELAGGPGMHVPGLRYTQPGALPAATLDQVIQAVRDLEMDDVRTRIARQEGAASQ